MEVEHSDLVIPSRQVLVPCSNCEKQKEEEYHKSGGYHPVNIGDIYSNGRYRVIRKLGCGIKSTVWLCRESRSRRTVALKIVHSNHQATKDAQKEIKLLKWVQKAYPYDERRMKILQLLNDFTIHGPNGKHVCMVLEIWGPNLVDLIKSNNKGLSIPQVKFIMKQILEALDYLHFNCGKTHANLNPKNILTYPKTSAVKIFGKDTENLVMSTGNHPSSMVIHPRGEYPKISTEARTRSKKKNLKKKTQKLREEMGDGSKAEKNDGGSVKEISDKDTETFPLDIKIQFRDKDWFDDHTEITCTQPPHQYRSPEMQLGHNLCQCTDIWSLACIAFELATGNYLFNPLVQSEKRCGLALAEEHLALVMSLLGEIPKEIRLEGPNSSNIFDIKTGNLKHAKEHDPCSLFDTLTRKYEMNDKDAQQFCEFLLPMLDYDRDKRATTFDCLKHKWILSLDNDNEALKPSESVTVVQGGIAEEKPGKSGDADANFISKSTVNSSSEPEFKVQIAEEKPRQNSNADTESITPSTLIPSPEAELQTVEDKSGQNGDGDAQCVSTPNVNPNSEPQLQVQTADEEPRQCGNADADSIAKSTVNPSPAYEVQTLEEKPEQGGNADTAIIWTSPLIPSPEPELQVQNAEKNLGQNADTENQSMSKLALNHPDPNWWSWFLGYSRYFFEKLFNALW